MATIALIAFAGGVSSATVSAGTFIASGLGSGLFTGLAAAGGAYIDSRILSSGNGSAKNAPNRDMRVQAAEEGAPLAAAFGTVRVQCTPIWTSELREKKHNNGGGKGGTGGNYLTYTYRCDVAYAVCAGQAAIKEVYANGKRIYSSSPDINLTFNPSGADATQTVQYGFHIGSNVAIRWTYYLEIESDDDTYDLSTISSGAQVTISGWTGANAGANGTWDVWSTRYDDQLDKSYLTIRQVGAVVPFNTPAASPFVDYTPGTESVTFFQSNAPFSTKQMSGFEPYDGADDQTVSPTIFALEPLGTPAFRGVTYFVLQDLQLADYGNVPPAQMEALVETDGYGDLLVGDVIRTICEGAGLEAGEIDVTACDEPCRGFSYLGAQAGITVLESLLIAYDIIKQERDGVLYFFPRSDAADVTIADADLACHQSGDDAPRDVSLTDGSAFDAPREVTVYYKDPDRKHQTGAQRTRRARNANDSALTIDLGTVHTASEAHAISARLLWLGHINARRCKLQIPPSYIGTIRESTRVSFTAHGQPMVVLLDQVDRGDNFMLACEGVFEDPRVLIQPAISESQAAGDSVSGAQNATGTQNPQTQPPFMEWAIFDNACLADRHVSVPGFYAYATLPDERLAFGGAELYESQDSGTTWNAIAQFQFEATAGYATTALSDAVSAGLWDDASTLDVFLYEGELESITDLQCLNGSNRAIVGSEVIGFANAELVARNTYRLTRLLRGLQATEAEIALHQAGERFVCITRPGVEFVPINLAAVGQPRIYRCVPFGGRLEDYSADQIEATAQGATVRPVAPVNLTATRNGSNDVVFNFTRRARGVTRLFAVQPVPIYEARSTWFVEVLDKATATTVVRTDSFSTTAALVSSNTYSAANQTSDGYTPGDPINVRVTPASDWLGRGVSATATV